MCQISINNEHSRMIHCKYGIFCKINTNTMQTEIFCFTHRCMLKPLCTCKSRVSAQEQISKQVVSLPYLLNMVFKIYIFNMLLLIQYYYIYSFSLRNVFKTSTYMYQPTLRKSKIRTLFIIVLTPPPPSPPSSPRKILIYVISIAL